jgi:hypothetical protein
MCEQFATDRSLSGWLLNHNYSYAQDPTVDTYRPLGRSGRRGSMDGTFRAREAAMTAGVGHAGGPA